MYFQLDAQQLELCRTVRRFLADRAPIGYVRSVYGDDRGTTGEVWRGLIDLGITGMLVPEASGGLGLGMVDLGTALEEMGRAIHPGPYLSSAVDATLMLLALRDSGVDGGGDGGIEGGVADELLHAMVAGDLVATVALLEPGRRYDWRSPGTTARPDGEAWVLTGRKVHVPDAAASDVLLVTATARHGLGVFAVDAAAVEIAPEPVLDGTRPQAGVLLDGAPGRLVGAQADATGAIGRAVDRAIIAHVTDALGTIDEITRRTVEYAGQREQFGKIIGSFQAVQHMCVEMFQRVEMLRSLAQHALWVADEGDPEATHRAAAMAAAFAGDAVREVGERAIQVHGGVGVTWEHDIGLFYKRCLSMQAPFGDAAQHYAAVADLILSRSGASDPGA